MGCRQVHHSAADGELCLQASIFVKRMQGYLEEFGKD
jgi:hypothetical protein